MCNSVRSSIRFGMQIIKNPMDLGKVKASLEAGNYADASWCAQLGMSIDGYMRTGAVQLSP